MLFVYKRYRLNQLRAAFGAVWVRFDAPFVRLEWSLISSCYAIPRLGGASIVSVLGVIFGRQILARISGG